MEKLSQQKISYLENSNMKQSLITKSEGDRLKLEIELNKLINSEESAAKKKAIKLKAYYEKLCDDESKSIERNQIYLNEIQRIDSQFSQLDAKLERLTNLKKECEIYLRTSYPKFMQENRIGIDHGLIENILENKSYSMQKGIGLVASNLQKITTLSQNKTADFLEPSRDDKKRFELNNNLNIDKMKQFTNKNQSIDSKNFDESQNSKISATSNLVPIDRNSPLNMNASNLVNFERDRPANLNSNEKNIENKQETEIKNEFIKKLISTTIAEHGREDNQINGNKIGMQTNNFGGLNTTGNILIREYEQEVQRQDTDMNATSNANNTMGISALIDAIGLDDIDKKSKKNANTKQESFKSLNAESHISEENIRDTKYSNNELEDSSTSFKRNDSLRQELNLKSMYRLLDYIELEIKHTIHPEKYYRQLEPHYKNKLEIIKYANEGSGALNMMDSGAISMVIQDQLPIVIRKYASKGCLFTPDLLGYSIADINEKIILTHLSTGTDKDLWNHLMKHLLSLKTMNSLDSKSIAELFAPALVGDNIFGIEKSKKFLEKIINLAAIQLNDPLAESMSCTETSMNKSLQLASSSKLKETSAYQQFILSSTHNSNKSTLRENKLSDNEEDDDEIDALVAPKNSSSNSKNQYKQVNTISSLSSPRKNHGDFDLSIASSVSENQKKSAKSDKLKSSGLTKDRLPVHLRDFEDSEDSEIDTDDVTEIKSPKTKSFKSEKDFEFYK